jgi:hypothetical protein
MVARCVDISGAAATSAGVAGTYHAQNDGGGAGFTVFKRDAGGRAWVVRGDIVKAAKQVDLRLPVVVGGATYARDSREPWANGSARAWGGMICAEMQIQNSTNWGMALVFYTLGNGNNGTWFGAASGGAVEVAASECGRVPTAYTAPRTTAPYYPMAAGTYYPMPVVAASSVATYAPLAYAPVGPHATGAARAGTQAPLPPGTQRHCIVIVGAYAGTYVALAPRGWTLLVADCPERPGISLLIGNLANFDLRQPVQSGGKTYAHATTKSRRGTTMAICQFAKTLAGLGPFRTALAYCTDLGATWWTDPMELRGGPNSNRAPKVGRVAMRASWKLC